MSPMLRAEFIVRHALNISNSEKKCLESLLDGGIRNAYKIKELTNYKHYPTVLRAVKKLEVKGLITKEGKDEIRKSTYYSINFDGRLYLSIIYNDIDEAYKLISAKSKHFIDVINVFNQTYMIKTIFENTYKEIFKNVSIRKEYDIDVIMETIIYNVFMEDFVELSNIINRNDFMTYKNESLSIIEESKKYYWIYGILQNVIKSLYKHSEDELKLYKELNEKINDDL